MTTGSPIALHHGSLDAAQRRKVEAAMAAGRLQAVVCTSSLDLGIDWGDVDLVINVGAPKGASRLTQRIGRANHRLDEPSKAVLIPANRFEVLECQAAHRGGRRGARRTPRRCAPARSTCSPSTCWAAPAASRSCRTSLYDEVRMAAPFAGLARADFDAVVDFVATGGYALKVYERFAKIRQGKDGRYRVANPRVAQHYRLNVGTIVEETMIKVRLMRSRPLGRARQAERSPGTGRPASIARGGRVLGELEEYFIEGLTPGDTFVFAGEVLRFEAMAQDEAYVSRAHADDPKVPAYAGGKFPLSTYLAARVRDLISQPSGVAGAAGPGARLARHPAVALAGAAARRAAGRDLSARRQELSRLLSVRGPARPPDARHAADAPARTRAAAAARLRRQRICAGGVEARRSRSRHSHRADVARRSCSTRTCWATTSRPGSPNRR